MSRVLLLVGPYLVKLLSSSTTQALALAVARYVIDLVIGRLSAQGYTSAAEIIRQIEKDLMADPAQLVSVVQSELGGVPTVAERAALASPAVVVPAMPPRQFGG